MIAALAVITLAVFLPVLSSSFLNWDDSDYVTGNPRVLAGWTAPGVLWAFTTGTANNWHPLTWLSHMLDVQIYGRRAWGHHLTNLLLHLANSALLFLVLEVYTAAFWPSALAAALFAVHPLHVESVAWVAERKDVLSGFFWIATLGAYAGFARRPSRGRRLVVIVLFVLGLMAKPMLVTIPLVLLLLDYWPLGRLSLGSGRTFRNLVGEKAPFFALAAAAAAVTFLVQFRSGAVTDLEVIPLGARLANAADSYLVYAGRTILPTGLSFYYRHPEGPRPAWLVAGAAALLLAASALVVRFRRRHPWLLTGWFWYVISLLPVIGIVQVGMQARADRYTYLPLIGLFLALSWSAAAAVRRCGRTAIVTAAAVGLALLAATARRQTGYWRDDITLFARAVAIDPGNYLAHNNLGSALRAAGRVGDAVEHFERAIRLKSSYATPHFNLGLILYESGDEEGALREFQEAVKDNPSLAGARNNLGSLLVKRGRLEEALVHLREANRLLPKDPSPPYNLGLVLQRMGRSAEAESSFRKALHLKPDFAAARAGLEEAARRRRLGE